MAAPAANELYLRQIEVGPMANFVYLIGDPEAKACVMVDPAWEVDRVVEQAKGDGMEVVGGLVTHWHPDHTNQIDRLLTTTKSKLHVNKNEETILQALVGRSEVVTRDHGDTLAIGRLSIRFLHTPGHTPGSQCFLLESTGKEGALVSGDTLFIGSCGRTDFPGGSPEEMYRSLEELAKLPGGTVLLPGHNYASRSVSTIKDERVNNPMMKFPSVDAFVAAHAGRRR